MTEASRPAPVVGDPFLTVQLSVLTGVVGEG
jgi:hypothetical protein